MFEYACLCRRHGVELFTSEEQFNRVTVLDKQQPAATLTESTELLCLAQVQAHVLGAKLLQ